VVVHAIDETAAVHLRRFSAEDQFDEQLLPLKGLDTHLEPYLFCAGAPGARPQPRP